MKTLRTIDPRLTALAITLALVAIAVPATAAHDDVVRDLRIAVADHNGREIAVISPADAVMLPRSEPVQLRMFYEVNGQRHNVPTEFRVARGSERLLNHTKNRQDRGEVTVEYYPNANPTGPSYLEYRIHDDVRLADERMRSGQVRIDVASGLGQAEADRLVGALYRGILLREPDQQGNYAARQAIQEGGWNGLVRFAQNLASSRESEMDLYERGSCNQQRLLAMYRELQGRDLRSVDQRTFRAHLEQMGRGDVDGVVMALMESAEFQDRFGLRTAWRR